MSSDWWGQMTSQFVGDLLAGAILLPVAVWAEARLDEALRVRQRRAERRKPRD